MPLLDPAAFHSSCPNPQVKNFHSSWSSGMAFCALINAYDPALLDFGALDPKNKLDNLKLVRVRVRVRVSSP